MSTLIDDMKRLESAEAFLDYFALPFDVSIVNVNRLHILKRFYQYLAQKGGIEQLPSASAFSTCRELLARAYTDFLNSSGIEQKVFKVFHAAHGEHRVSIGSVRKATA